MSRRRRFPTRTLAGGFLWLMTVQMGVSQMPPWRRPDSSDAQRKKDPMIKAVPGSPSAVLRATHILLFRIESSRPSPFTTNAVGNPERTVGLTVVVEEVLKGEIQYPPGTPVQLEIRQTGRLGTRMYMVPGVWSDQPIDPGTRLVAFAAGPTGRVAELLADPYCFRILPPEECRNDVRLALRAESGDVSTTDLLKTANSGASYLHYVFAEYLVARLNGSLLSNLEDFRLLMAFLENPALPGVPRSTVLTFAGNQMAALAPAPRAYVESLAATMFHLIGLPQAAPLAGNLIGVYLPNLLGLRGGAPRQRASDLFQDAPKERQRAAQILRDYHGPEPTGGLREWLAE